MQLSIVGVADILVALGVLWPLGVVGPPREVQVVFQEMLFTLTILATAMAGFLAVDAPAGASGAGSAGRLTRPATGGDDPGKFVVLRDVLSWLGQHDARFSS